MTGEEAEGIAIVGMAGRFPGARNVDAFWQNIKNGVESVTHFPPDELEIALDGDDSADTSHYVCAKGMLDDIDMFDARFFGYLPREAEVMDPQHRIFLEICWEAMELAGYDCSRYPGAVGVFGGCYMDTYVLWNLCSNDTFRKKLVESIQVGTLQTELGNDKDYLATRVAYKLGLRGPAMTLQTACSTSLVAVATACQSLDAYQSDMALAGGVTLILPQKKGYHYKEGGMLSPDGHCRTFDEKAAGTVFSHGAAVVVLKRLEDALADRDTIYGVIRGYAANNDGGDKISYTAPSVEGQAEVISNALGLGDIDAGTIGYVEAHGTATPLGDPIETAGLTQAYRQYTDEVQYCAIGSVKANLGHLDVASGAIGLIKTTLALHEKVLPPQINFSQPNPKIEIEKTPFYVNTKLSSWPEKPWPRRAGVSSFGVGGTNAHVVLEEAPHIATSEGQRTQHLLPLSARSHSALCAQATQLADYLEQSPSTSLINTAHTLQVGRKEFEHRTTIVAATIADAVLKLRDAASAKAHKADKTPQLVFMFPGQGAQYPGMGRALYESEPTFRDVIDRIALVILDNPDYGFDIRRFICWNADSADKSYEESSRAMAQTRIAQPAIYAVEIALANLLAQWGLTPSALIGHSIGEVAAAVYAGVFSLEDGALLTAERGRLMQAQTPGSMLAILAPVCAIEKRLPEHVTLAAVNAPNATVVSGPKDRIEKFANALAKEEIKSTLLATSHAFHSPMMNDARTPLTEFVASMNREPASTPIISTLTGEPVTPECFSDPGYWGEQLVNPVRFSDAVQKASAMDRDHLFVEVGPGQALKSFTTQSLTGELKRPVLSALGPQRSPGSDTEYVLRLTGDLWSLGARPNWEAMQSGAPMRIALPTYPFERKRFWVDPEAEVEVEVGGAQKTVQSPPQSANGKEQVSLLVKEQLKLINSQLEIMRQSS